MSKRVYFLRPVGHLGPIKIGCSIFPEKRLEALTLWSPTPLELICSVPGEHKHERTLHGMFRRYHVHGEWFHASKELLELIEQCEAFGALPQLPEVVHLPLKKRRKHKAERTLRPSTAKEAAEMIAAYASGETVPQIAERFGISEFAVKYRLRAAGLKRKRGRPAGFGAGPRDKARASEIKRRRARGETYQSIASSLGLTRQRVHQIMAKAHGPRAPHSTSRACSSPTGAHLAGEASEPVSPASFSNRRVG